MPNNDLISRAAAIDALTNTNLERNIDSVCDGDMNRTRRAAQRVIAQLPAVDAVPVVHGEWIDDADPCEIVGEHWMCSNCEMVFGMPEDTMRIHHYCPYCGAKMNAPTCGPDYCEIGGNDNADGETPLSR